MTTEHGALRASSLDRLRGIDLRLRNLAAALAAACALVYAAIGLGLIYAQPEEGVRLWVFGFSAALAFASGVALLLWRPGRVVLILGALFQVFAIVAYVLVSRDRHPAFEIWGVALKVAQAGILAALVALLVRDGRRREA